MEEYVNLDDVASVFDLCMGIECSECVFDNLNSPDCKIMLWMEHLPKIRADLTAED